MRTGANRPDRQGKHVGELRDGPLRSGSPTRNGHHSFNFAKYAHRYLAEFQYRFNRRFDMKIILSRLLSALVFAPPSSERVLRGAEVSR